MCHFWKQIQNQERWEKAVTQRDEARFDLQAYLSEDFLYDSDTLKKKKKSRIYHRENSEWQ